MRLRSRFIPQAGTNASREGESRPEPSSSGSPTYSEGGITSQQPTTDATKSSSSPSSTPSTSSQVTPSTHQSSSLTPIPSNVVQEACANNPVPVAGTKNPKKRMRWTEEMNIHIMRQYYIITKLEQNTRGYLPTLHPKFIETFPEMNVSRQRVGDQRRAIVERRLLTDAKLNEIKADVAKFLREPSNNITNDTVTKGQRRRWTNEMNEIIIRNYFRITELETNRSAYRQPLHQAVIKEYPLLSDVSEQRISDQLRVIMNNNMITDERLQSIKQEVRQGLQQNTNSLANVELQDT